MSREEQNQELEALQQARKEGKITDSQRLRLSELKKEEKEEKKEAKATTTTTTGPAAAGTGALKK